jgi:hypothetical protein
MSDTDTAPRVRAERLAELSDAARRLGRKEQADRFLLAAWLAYDEDDAFEAESFKSAA